VEGVESVGRRGAGRVLVGAVGSLDDAVLATNATARFPGHGPGRGRRVAATNSTRCRSVTRAELDARPPRIAYNASGVDQWAFGQ
jgi:hypothetical protein